MKTVTVRQIRNAFPSVLRLIRNGETVEITSRRKVVAWLTPPSVKTGSGRLHPWADLDARLAELQQLPMLPVSPVDKPVRSSRLINESQQRDIHNYAEETDPTLEGGNGCTGDSCRGALDRCFDSQVQSYLGSNCSPVRRW
jgi:antitoxin (DNA-binding transcriptional repressor) of toxin-antitoxin stability system